MSTSAGVDTVYVATSANDARATRICVASIRYVYPDVPVRLLLGGRVEASRLRELRDVWDAHPAEGVAPGEYGWGFVKLEPLFGARPERFLVLDSDTVLLGPVLDALPDAPFVVDREEQTDDEVRRLYYDWRDVRSVDPDAAPPAFVSNTGQWVGTAGVLRREEFEPYVRPSWPRALRHPDLFRQGEQGLFNYVLNRKARLDGAAVARHPLMRWPGHDTTDVTLADVTLGPASPHATLMHWAGFKAAHLGGMPRADLLLHFERLHYAAQGSGEALRLARAARDAARFEASRLATRVRLRAQRLRATPA